MRPFNKLHMQRVLVATIAMATIGQEQFQTIVAPGVFQKFALEAEVTFEGTNAVPAGGAPGILNLFEELSIRYNGNKLPDYKASGEQLYYNHFRDTGVAPYSVPSIGSGGTSQTLTANFDWRFDVPNIATAFLNKTYGTVGRQSFGLDTRPLVGTSAPTIEIGIKYADLANVIGLPGVDMTGVDTTITSAVLKVYGYRYRFPTAVAGTSKTWTTETRRVASAATGSPRNEIEIPRIQGTILMDVMVVQKEGIGSVAFDDSGVMTVRHDDYYRDKELPIRVMRAESWDIRKNVIPDNLALVNFIENGWIGSGMNDIELSTQPLTVELPFSEGSASAATKSMVTYARFARPPQVA